MVIAADQVISWLGSGDHFPAFGDSDCKRRADRRSQLVVLLTPPFAFSTGYFSPFRFNFSTIASRRSIIPRFTQVTSILGKPTTAQNVGGFQTLFYQGEIISVPGLGRRSFPVSGPQHLHLINLVFRCRSVRAYRAPAKWTPQR